MYLYHLFTSPLMRTWRVSLEFCLSAVVAWRVKSHLSKHGLVYLVSQNDIQTKPKICTYVQYNMHTQKRHVEYCHTVKSAMARRPSAENEPLTKDVSSELNVFKVELLTGFCIYIGMYSHIANNYIEVHVRHRTVYSKWNATRLVDEVYRVNFARYLNLNKIFINFVVYTPPSIYS